MTSDLNNDRANYAALARLRPPREYLAVKVAALILAVCVPLSVASFAARHGRWDFFERSGSLTSAVGLFLASRRYLGRGALELAAERIMEQSRPSVIEALEDIYTAKLGLGLSAFGMIIWGWGAYLRWWTFGCLAAWVALEASNVWRDFVQLRAAPGDGPPAEANT